MGKLECMRRDFRSVPWAPKLMVSLQMGIFLCMRCASIHRKLGTHISKVKSLSMDSWSSEQVDVSESYSPRSNPCQALTKMARD